MSTIIGLGNPVLKINTERLGTEVADFEEHCITTASQIENLRKDFSLLSHWGTKDKERIVSNLMGATINAKIQLTPRSDCLKQQITRTEDLVRQSSNPELLGVYQELSARVDSAATCLRAQRESSKKELAPATTWKDFLLNGYSPRQFADRVCDTTTNRTEIIVSDN